LGLLPVVWKNGWPVLGENVKAGTYEIQSERRGFGLELAVDPTNAQGGGGGFGGGGRGAAGPVKPVPTQQVGDVIKNWPTGDVTTRIGDYIARPHQKWAITPAPDSSGYFGAPYYKITIDGTERALAASTGGRVITVPTYTGAPEQLWKLDQLTDGTFRIMPKAIPDSKEKLALISAGDSTPALGKFVLESDNSKWNFVAQ
jgi:arabinan endo-1,5-alpha-L-arabinosidase